MSFIDFDGSTSFADEPLDENATCNATYTTGGSDPYSTACDQPAGHNRYGIGTSHEGPDPLGSSMRVRWNGGGSCAGDPLPYRDVEWLTAPTSAHDEHMHHLLAPHDLPVHIRDEHHVELSEIETRVDAETWLEKRGIESTGGHDLDCLLAWHTATHHEWEQPTW